MGKGKTVLFPRTAKKMQTVGEQIKLARLRRHMSMESVAMRAGISRSTLIKIEKGDYGVPIGMYVSVLNVFGLQDDILLLAGNDPIGNAYRDLELLTPKRATRRPE